jgi:hypothetical protein
MSGARIICTLSWGACDVLKKTDPTNLGKTLVNLIRKHGAETTSDVLSQGHCWEYLDEEADGCDENMVQEYGKLAEDVFCDVNECDYIYGIMSDGTLQITRCYDGDTVFVEPMDENAQSIVEQLFD